MALDLFETARDLNRNRGANSSVDRINGEALEKLLNEKNMTTANLAIMAKVSEQTIKRYIRGDDLLISDRLLNRICDALTCDPLEIILLPGEKSSVFVGQELPTEAEPHQGFGLADAPKPQFDKGATYLINSTGKTKASVFDGGKFLFVGTGHRTRSRSFVGGGNGSCSHEKCSTDGIPDSSL